MEIQDKLLHRKGMLWVPEGLEWEILESDHDAKVTSHMSQDKTIKLV